MGVMEGMGRRESIKMCWIGFFIRWILFLWVLCLSCTCFTIR